MSRRLSTHTNAIAPEGVRLYAIGDIHGRADLAKTMIELIEQDRAGHDAPAVAIFLGDYIDRGPDSKGVVSLLSEGLPADIEPVFLKGNHEDLMLAFLDGTDAGLDWLRNGGDATLMSYGVDVRTVLSAYRSEKGMAEARQRFVDRLPKSHEAFFRSLSLFYRSGDYFFVHAGVRPGIALEEQDPEDLIWIRGPFLKYRNDYGAVVVHGHTPVEHPEDLQNRVGIDTLAFHTGRLTAAAMEADRRWFLST